MGDSPPIGARVSQPLRSAPPEPRAPANPRMAELERRIALFEAEDDDSFGRFAGVDWLALWVFAVALPLVVLWRCAG
jgi:hypothetical protein